MKTSIFIPKQITVGYQNRSDTYTGKLAYIIYTDEKGKLRKEKSWNGWRDKSIESNKFENVPTEGFVLNRHAGGVQEQWGWNARRSYCRIYDPRNFEFEITIENLLYILENTNSIKGKGLEGEFVYGWDGTELVLLPVDSPDYKKIQEYSNIISENKIIKAKDLILGATYLDKKNLEWIYIGKHNYYDYGYRWLNTKGEYECCKRYYDIPQNNYHYKVDYDTFDMYYGEYHWFARKIYKRDECSSYHWSFLSMRNVSGSKFIKCVNENCSEKYAEIFEAMTHEWHFSPRDKSKDKFILYSFDEFKECVKDVYNSCYLENSLYHCESDNGKIIEYRMHIEDGLYKVTNYCENEEDYYKRFKFNEIEIPKKYSFQANAYKREFVLLTLEQLYERLQPGYVEHYLENGNLYSRSNYYGNEE